MPKKPQLFTCFKIEVRLTHASERKKRLMLKAVKVAARHLFCTAMLCTMNGETPSIGVFEENFFDGHKTLSLAKKGKR